LVTKRNLKPLSSRMRITLIELVLLNKREKIEEARNKGKKNKK
jgi:hypothetical protein